MRNRQQIASVVKASEYVYIAADGFEPETGSIRNIHTYTKNDKKYLILMTKECESTSLGCFQKMFDLKAHVQKVPIKWEDAMYKIIGNGAYGAICCCDTEMSIFTIEELSVLKNIKISEKTTTTPQKTEPSKTDPAQSKEPPAPAPSTPDATGKVENAFKNNAALLNRLSQNASKNANPSSNKVASAFNNSSFLKNMNPGTADTKE